MHSFFSKDKEKDTVTLQLNNYKKEIFKEVDDHVIFYFSPLKKKDKQTNKKPRQTNKQDQDKEGNKQTGQIKGKYTTRYLE